MDAEKCLKGLFAYLKRRCRASHNMLSLLTHDWRLVEDSTQRAEALPFQNQSVLTVGVSTYGADLKSLLGLSELNALRVNQSDVFNKRSRIKSRKTFEPSGLNPKLIRELTPVIAVLVSDIFKKMLETEIITEV